MRLWYDVYRLVVTLTFRRFEFHDIASIRRLRLVTRCLSAGYDFDTVEEEEDADALADPVYHVDLKQYLTEYLSSFCQQPYIALFAPHLQTGERHVLAQIGVRTV